jgi:hypothetical protein
MGTEPVVCSATQNSNGSYILGVVVRYSLRASLLVKQPRGHVQQRDNCCL